MLINDLIDLLEELPRTLAAGWAAWLFVGLLLSVWQRRDEPPPGRARLRAATQVRRAPAVGVRAPARPVKSVPMSSGDAFGELEALLEPPAGTHRMPGESRRC